MANGYDLECAGAIASGQRLRSFSFFHRRRIAVQTLSNDYSLEFKATGQ